MFKVVKTIESQKADILAVRNVEKKLLDKAEQEDLTYFKRMYNKRVEELQSQISETSTQLIQGLSVRDTRHNLLKTHLTKLQKETDTNSRDIKIHADKFVNYLKMIEETEQRIFAVK